MKKARKTPRRGFSYLEVLVAALLLTIVSTAAFASWSLSGRVTTAKRVTEMCVFVGTSEIERLKAQPYDALQDATTTAYYDKNGAYIPSSDTTMTHVYKAVTVVSAVVAGATANTTRDLRQIQVTVSNVNNTKANNTHDSPVWTCQTLITFGGV